MINRENSQIASKSKRLATVPQMPNYYPAFSTASIRWLIFNSQSNGFGGCVRRVGRKVLIDLDQFELWIDGQTKGDVK